MTTQLERFFKIQNPPTLSWYWATITQLLYQRFAHSAKVWIHCLPYPASPQNWLSWLYLIMYFICKIGWLLYCILLGLSTSTDTLNVLPQVGSSVVYLVRLHALVNSGNCNKASVLLGFLVSDSTSKPSIYWIPMDPSGGRAFSKFSCKWLEKY